MSDIIAGSPAPTNPTARDWLLNYAGDSDWRTQVDRVLAQHRAEALAEAIEAARSEYLTDSTGESEDDSYNQAIADVINGLNALAQGGAVMSARDEMARRVAELEAAAARARAVHQKYDDSEHCRHDGESWPCPTIVALTEGGAR